MIKTESFQKVEIQSQNELREWLLQNHKQENSIWLVTFKKVVIEKYVSKEEVLDELICFGWIDGIRRQLSDEKTMQLISPRKTQYWSKSYKERAKKLIDENKMHEAGFNSIKASKENESWNFMMMLINS